MNGRQNTSIDFLHYNFLQINDNVVTVKNDVDHATTVSDMQKHSSIDQVLKEVLIYLNHYHMKSLILITMQLMQIHLKYQVWTTQPMKCLHRIVVIQT